MQKHFKKISSISVFQKTLSLVMAVVFSLFVQSNLRAEEPGQIKKRFEKSIKAKSIKKKSIEVKKEKGIKVPKGADKTFFVLSKITFSGATVFSEGDFIELYEEFLDKKVSLTDIYNIAEAITVKYKKEGYVLSRAFIPPQTIKNGVVQILIIEGFIDKVFIEGEIKGRESLLDSYKNKIISDRPLRIKTLERYLLLMSDLPGVSLKSVMQPSADQMGASSLTIDLDHKFVAGSLSYDNRGTKNIGPNQTSTGLSFDSILGLYENTSILGSTVIEETQELVYLDVSHSEYIGSEGLKVTISGGRSDSSPGGTLKELDIESKGSSYSFAASYPVIRLREKNLNLNMGFTYRDSMTKAIGETITDDRLRIATAGFSFDMLDAYNGVNQLSFEVSQGLNIMDESSTGSENISRATAHSDFTKYNIDISRSQHLGSGFSFLVSAAGQWSAKKLFASDEFTVGGSRFGRGHDPSEISGDHGFACLSELQYTVNIDKFYLDSLQPFIYGDYGQVFQKDDGSHDELASTGGGIRIFTKYLTGSIELDKPVKHKVEAEGNKRERVFFSLTGRF